MVSEWAMMLGLRGWTPAELMAASEWVLLHDPPSARAKHVQALEARLLVARQEKQATPPDDQGCCVVCEGNGMVIVPFLAGMKTAGGKVIPDDGKFRTCIVRCNCALGRWQQRGESKYTIMPLREYEATNPGWREQMADRAEFLRLSAGNAAFSSSLDQALGAIKLRRVSMQGGAS